MLLQSLASGGVEETQQRWPPARPLVIHVQEGKTYHGKGKEHCIFVPLSTRFFCFSKQGSHIFFLHLPAYDIASDA